MKKYLFLVIALCYTVVTNAQGTDQSSAILQHGDEATFFKGSTAFKQAYAAAADGDVIILSEGTFEPVRIEKRLTIYGAGFEKNAETNTAITAFSAEAARLIPGNDFIALKLVLAIAPTVPAVISDLNTLSTVFSSSVSSLILYVLPS